jgi:hypothetical protein
MAEVLEEARVLVGDILELGMGSRSVTPFHQSSKASSRVNPQNWLNWIAM